MRTASDQPYRLRKFKLRIVYASDVRQPDIEVLATRIALYFIRDCTDSGNEVELWL